MELLQLQYFLQLANLQHVSRAAERMHISQPSLSATIKKLEYELGAPLFMRKGRNIVLSSYGEAFKTYAEQALLALENGRQAVINMKSADDSTLDLGILSPYIWNELFSQFTDRYPHFKINRYSIEDDQFYDSILEGRIDLYLGGINFRSSINTDEIEYIPLYEDDMVLLIPEDHPFAGRDSIDLCECRGERFISLDESTSLQQFINYMFEQAGFRPDVVMVCDYTLRDRMVSEKHGVSLTTKLAAEKTEAKGVKYLTVTNPTEKRKLGLVWRRGKLLSDSMQKFCDTARNFYLNIE